MRARLITPKNILFVITGIFILFLIAMSKSGKNAPFKPIAPPQKQMNLIIAVDWSGSILSIPNFRGVLKNEVGDKIVQYVMEAEKNYRVNYRLLYFGLPRYNPSFRDNYLKFSREQNWKRFIAGLRTKEMGYLTALTLIKELALIRTNFPLLGYKTELILITDNVLNGDRESEIISFRNYNRQASDSEKIAYLDEVQKLANQVNKEFIFKEVETEKFNDLYFRRFEVLVNEQLSFRHFFKFSEPLEATPTTYNTHRLTIHIDALNRLSDKKFQLTGIQFVIWDSLNTFEKKGYYPDSSLTNLFERKSVDLLLLDEDLSKYKSLKCKMEARFVRKDGILKGQYGFVLSEPLAVKVNHRKSFLGIPVNGYLLYKIGIIKSQATLMMIVWLFMGVVVLLWGGYFLFPYIYPPIPGIKAEFVKGGKV